MSEHTHEYSQPYEHSHTHADGIVHSNEQSHSHADGTVHTHEQSHSHAAASSPEEALALLKYMLAHNRHHAEELHDIAHFYDNVEGDLLHDAVDRLNDSNALIEQALSLITNK